MNIFSQGRRFPRRLFSDATVSAVGSGLQNWGRLQNRTRHVGEALSLPKLTQPGGSMNGSSFPTQTVGADRIRPQHKAPLRGACAGSTYSSTLQGVYAHPGACENPWLRADSIRPYKAYAFIRVLAEIRGYGRLLAAPTVCVGSWYHSMNTPLSYSRFGVQYRHRAG